MMRTDDLIAQLAHEAPAARPSVAWPFVWVLLAIAALCGLVLAALLGAPLRALAETGAAALVMKLSFAISVAAIGGVAVYRASLPGRPIGLAIAALAIPFAAVALLAGIELSVAGPGGLGGTRARCLAAVAGLGFCSSAGVIWAMRRLAPTRPRVAGALAGVTGGGLAASAYALWCPETSAQFLALWYAMPIAALGLLGALAGPRMLRW